MSGRFPVEIFLPDPFFLARRKPKGSLGGLLGGAFGGIFVVERIFL